jgi:tRNA_anti-like
MNRKRSIQIFFLLSGLFAIALVIVAYKMYTKPNRLVENETAIVIGATKLFDTYEKSESVADTKYLNQVLEVTGKVSEISANMDNKKVILLETSNPMFGVRCTMQDSLISIQVGTTITIKGICTGYLSDVVITNGILKN